MDANQARADTNLKESKEEIMVKMENEIRII
jgi:hypothetical protein